MLTRPAGLLRANDADPLAAAAGSFFGDNDSSVEAADGPRGFQRRVLFAHAASASSGNAPVFAISFPGDSQLRRHASLPLGFLALLLP